MQNTCLDLHRPLKKREFEKHKLDHTQALCSASTMRFQKKSYRSHKTWIIVHALMNFRFNFWLAHIASQAPSLAHFSSFSFNVRTHTETYNSLLTIFFNSLFISLRTHQTAHSMKFFFCAKNRSESDRRLESINNILPHMCKATATFSDKFYEIIFSLLHCFNT